MNSKNMVNNFFLIAGPCVIESEKLCLDIAETICSITQKLNISYYFKASYRKANRSRSDSFTGIGDEIGLNILRKVKETFNIPVVTDIHTPQEAKMVADYGIDVLQIPAFLSRQTDLLLAAGHTGCIVNIKKGQFLAPETMGFAVNKVKETGNDKIMLTERGSMFGYRDLIVDFRSIIEMKKTGCPVVTDVTHSLQQPNQLSGVSGGRPELIEIIARAAVVVGSDGIFIETHPNPQEAKSDGANMLQLSLLEPLLCKLVAIKQLINSF
ncbi:MAG: 3-deoxy-8-phosphooctulonate synthase [Prevotellaceae bacterium]|jgi:2-dehydro-3-deoxyphosphooctonate aldolase (KDO 8-P synthase)|nr:3-deoxy-8-phosphooctulonate synthase [Prevotellaceae bacterium]